MGALGLALCLITILAHTSTPSAGGAPKSRTGVLQGGRENDKLEAYERKESLISSQGNSFAKQNLTPKDQDSEANRIQKHNSVEDKLRRTFEQIERSPPKYGAKLESQKKQISSLKELYGESKQLQQDSTVKNLAKKEQKKDTNKRGERPRIGVQKHKPKKLAKEFSSKSEKETVSPTKALNSKEGLSFGYKPGGKKNAKEDEEKADSTVRVWEEEDGGESGLKPTKSASKEDRLGYDGRKATLTKRRSSQQRKTSNSNWWRWNRRFIANRVVNTLRGE